MRLLFYILIVVGLAGATTVARAESKLYYILDGSGSMWAKFEGRTRIEVAKDLLRDRLPKWQAENTHVGLVAYGHNRKGDCDDIEVLVELGPAQTDAIEKAIEGINPKGKTPIAASIDLVADRLRTSEEAAHVILISDGKENCHPDPCGSVRRLRQLGIKFTMDVVGFDVTEEERAQLQCLAKEGGGSYYTAASAPEALDAIVRAEEKAEEKIALLKDAPAPVVKVSQNIEFVIDMSASMAEPFDRSTKIQTVLSRMTEKLSDKVSDQENLALRVFGGTCDASSATRLAVPFGTGNAAAILAELEKESLGGQPTLAASLLAAIDDFDDPDRFEGVSRRIVLFTGSAGACDPMLPWEVQKKFDAARIDAVLHLIAMDPPQNHIDDIRNMTAAGGGYLHVVRTEEELDRVLTSILEVEPVRAGIQAIMQMLNGVVNHVNASSQAANQGDFVQASAEIEAGKRLIFDTSVQFEDLGARASRKTFRKLYELANANRGLQRELLKIAEEFMEARKANDIATSNRLTGSWNDSVSKYNSNIRAIETLIRGL